MELAQRLISTRRGTVLVAAIAALLAGAMILVYVDRYRTTLETQGAPVTVLVARHTIHKGSAGDVIASKGLYTATTIREGQLLEGAFSDPSSLRGRVAARDIYPGAQLTAADFASSNDALAASLTEVQRVVSIPLDAAHGLIGDIAAGDRVDIFAGFNVVPLRADGTPVSGGQSRAVLKRIMADIQVLGVGAGKSGGLTGSGATNVQLKVTDEQAANLAFASDNGKIWLALRPSAGAKANPPSIVTVETLLLGVRPVNVMRSFGGRS
ncbi:MAG TPA: Flp pilus assembly protein CpaB [Gaiellaceae bacterium]|nr:Flp pilus assembly protein CpaB [Gaiellaceae bacterium]